MDRLVPCMELAQRFGFVAAPHAGGDDPGDPALCKNGIAEVTAAVGAIGKHLAGLSGKASGPALPSLILADVIETSSIRAVSASAPTWALKPWTARFPLCFTRRASSSSSLAGAMMVASTSVPVLTVTAFDLSCIVTASNRARSSLYATSSLRNLTKAVRSGVASFAENPQKRRKEARSSSASASFTSDRSYQIDRSRALNIACGGQAGSPLVAG